MTGTKGFDGPKVQPGSTGSAGVLGGGCVQVRAVLPESKRMLPTSVLGLAPPRHWRRFSGRSSEIGRMALQKWFQHEGPNPGRV